MSAPRIADLQAIVVRAPLGEGIAMSFGRMRTRQALLVVVTDDTGRTGVGECWVNWPRWAPEERLVLLREGIAPLLVGRELSSWQAVADDIHHALARQYGQAGSPGPLWHVISAVDQALWDLETERFAPTDIEVYGSGLGPDNIERDARRAQDMGISTVKLRVGFDHATDEANVRAARGVLGDGVSIAVDANQSYDLEEAVAASRYLVDLGVSWIEEPIAGDSLDDLRRFHEVTGLSIATGENLYDLDEYANRAACPGITILQPDVTKLGGITRTMQLAELLSPYDVEVVPHMYGGPVGVAATLRLAAECPSVMRVEFDMRANPLADLPKPVDGRLRTFPDHASAMALMDHVEREVHELAPPQPHTPAMAATPQARRETL